MTPKQKFLSRRNLTTAVAAGATAIGLGFGGYAIAHSTTSKGVTASATVPSSQPSPSVSGTAIPFQPGQPGASKVVGQVPASYRAGTGTIVTGAAADKAKAAAVAAFPGGTVNRVVLLSSGDYNVHIIGVNWPHHVFVNSTFTVIGAE
ncbi:MAG TPA: hypothetical protein VGQ42_11985 [Candidatus Dormibacteraeota bacterium]|jgi:hypothetical protein|nr:hypothetical protein [Candidatus Dormibacteraeota bacterium]